MSEDSENKKEPNPDSELDNILDDVISGDDKAESTEESETEPDLDNMLDDLIDNDTKIKKDSDEKEAIAKAKNIENIKKNLINKKIVKNVFVKNKVINFIIT